MAEGVERVAVGGVRRRVAFSCILRTSKRLHAAALDGLYFCPRSVIGLQVLAAMSEMRLRRRVRVMVCRSCDVMNVGLHVNRRC